MKRKLPPFHDLIKTIDIRLLMIRVEEPNRENCSWSIGLVDKSGEPSLNYFKCETEAKALELIDSILSRYDDLERGQDIGNVGGRNYVYLKTTN
jgi:hypothetical protein